MSSSPKYALVMATEVPSDVVPVEFTSVDTKTPAVPSFYPGTTLSGYDVPQSVSINNGQTVQDIQDKINESSSHNPASDNLLNPSKIVVTPPPVISEDIVDRRRLQLKKVRTVIAFISIVQVLTGIFTIVLSFNIVGIIYGITHIGTGMLGSSSIRPRSRISNAWRYYLANIGQTSFTSLIYAISFIVAISRSIPIAEAIIDTIGILFILMMQVSVCRISRYHLEGLKAIQG